MLFAKTQQYQQIKQQIATYSNEHYGNFITLNEAELTQLAWLQLNLEPTPEANVTLSTTIAGGHPTDTTPFKPSIEIKRALARRNCLQLLLNGGLYDYHQFTITQEQAQKLSRESFNRLSQFIRELAPEVLEVVQASCFIADSTPAREQSQIPTSELPDSEQFVSKTMEQCPHIYPIYANLSNQAKALLTFTYLKDTHARHMLYVEGGNNMYQQARTVFSSLENTTGYEAWLGRWLINIAGFRGHIEPEGSKYLNEPTAQAMFMLQDSLIQLQTNPEFDILNHYLLARSEAIKIAHPYLSYLATQMRLYTVEEGRELTSWFNLLDEETKDNYARALKMFHDTIKTSPTYLPCVLDNLKELGVSINDRAHIFSQIISTVIPQYFEKIEQGEISETTPLSFKQFAWRENLTVLLDHYHENTQRLTETLSISNEGILSYNISPLQKTK